MKKLILSLIMITISAITVFADNNEDLFNACKKGDLEGVKSAISKGASVSATDKEGHTPISHSFFWPEIVKYLLDNGADITSSAVIMNSCTFYCDETFKLLVSKGLDVNKLATIKYKADNAAVYRGLMEAEIAKGKDGNKSMISMYEKLINSAGAPTPVIVPVYPIFLGIGSGNKAIIDELVKVNANFKFVADDGQSSIGKFVQSVKSPEVNVSYIQASVKTLEGRGYTIPDWFKNMDKNKFYAPNEVLGILVSNGCDVNTKIKTGVGEKTPLMTALGYKGISPSDPDAIIALVKAGANVNEEDDKWGIPLNISIRKGNLDIVKAVVAAGANVNVESKEYDENSQQYSKGFTPLSVAAMIDKLDIVKLLLTSGAKPAEGVYGFSFNIKTGCATNVKNKTAIYYAIENGNLEMVKTFAEGTTYNWTEKEYETKQLEQRTKLPGYTVITCFKDGKYTPSKYAKEVGLKVIQEYLKTKNL